MAASYIQLPADSTGKKVQSWENTVGSDSVHTQAMVLTDTAGAAITVFPVSGTITANQGGAPWSVGGNVASESADSGNPVKVGAVFNSIPPALDNGHRVDLQADSIGSLRVVLHGIDSANGVQVETFAADSVAATKTGLYAHSHLYGYDAANSHWDRLHLFDLTNAQALTVAIVDGSGDQITSFGGGTQYAEDAAFGGNGTGTLMIARRDDVLSALTPVEDDAVGLRVNSLGALWTVPDGGIAHGATDAGNPIKIGGKAATNIPSDVDVGDRVDAWFTRAGMLNVVPRTASGVAPSSMSAPAIDGSSNSVESLLFYTRLYVYDNAGGHWDRMRGDDTGGIWAQGNVASGATDAGNPIKMGGRYNSTKPTLTDGQRGDLQLGTRGSLAVQIHSRDSADAAVVSAAGALNTEIVSSIPAGSNVIGKAVVSWTDGTVASVMQHDDGIAQGFNGLLTYNRNLGWDAANSHWDRIHLLDLTNAQAMTVAIVDGSGTQITSFGGGTQYAEDAAFSGNATGTAMIARRDDVLSALTPVEDDAVGLRVNSLGALWTVPDGSAASGATDAGRPIKIGGVHNTTQPTLSNGQRGDAQMDTRGNLKVTLRAQDSNDPFYNNIHLDAIGGPGASTPALGVISFGALYNQGASGYDRLRSIEDKKTASSTPDVGIMAALAPDRRFSSVSLGTAANSTQSWDCMGADSAVVYVGTSTTGTLIFEVSADGTNWQSAETRLTSNDSWQTAVNQTPTSGNVYRIITAGYRSMRARTVSTLGATVSLITTLASDSPIVLALKTGAAPHAIGYTYTSKTVQTTTTQTGTDVWSPASGKRIVITSYQIQAGGTTAGTVQLWFGANADTTYTRGTDLAIFDGEFAPSATLKPGVVQTGVWMASAVDHEVHLTTSAAINPLTVTLWGYEI